jgi:hypothetical protein
MIITLMAAAAAVATPAPATSPPESDFAFTYRYPATLARFPGLRHWLLADRDALHAKTARAAAAGKRDATATGYPYRRYETQRDWKQVTQTPRFISLSMTQYVFTGGAHGAPSSGALLWDKATNQTRATTSLFTSDAALWQAIRARYCPALKAERARRMGDDATPGIAPACPPLKDLTVLLGSTDGTAFDRIGLIADPYVAGAYVEGSYEVTLPVTPALIAAVKPAYRVAFAIPR